MRKAVIVLIAALLIALVGAPTVATADPRQPSPGAPGVGDPYFPTDGYGGV